MWFKETLLIEGMIKRKNEMISIETFEKINDVIENTTMDVITSN